MEGQGSPLDAELAAVKSVNRALEQVLASLATSSDNLSQSDNAVLSADRLLSLWTRVLAKSEQAQRLILDETWQGASADLQAEQERANQSLQEQQRQAELIRQQEMEEEDRRHRAEETKAAAVAAQQAASLASSSQLSSDGIGSRRGSNVRTGTRGFSARGRGAALNARGGLGNSTTRQAPAAPAPSAYAQQRRTVSSSTSGVTATTAAAAARAATVATTIDSQGAANSRTGVPSSTRGRGAPVVRGTRASRGRQAAAGRQVSADQAFR